MADVLRVVAVDAQSGTDLGTLTMRDGTIVPDGGIAEGVLDSIRTRTRGRVPDEQIWATLHERGWSNGYVTVEAATA